jgi:RNA 2',3'-cyclic 3'-phosphodiesterase
MKTMRCFLALKLSLETAENITLSQKALKPRCATAGMSIRWVPPPNIHMTMLFLGDITEPMASAVKDMLEPVAGNFEPFELSCVGMGAFPDVAQPKVVWAGLGEGADKIAQLHGAIRERLEAAGFHFSDRPFAAHITVGRVKSGPPGVLASCLAEEAAREFGTGVIRQLHCFRSDLSPAGAEYTTLWALPFQKKAASKVQSPVPPEQTDLESIGEKKDSPDEGAAPNLTNEEGES